MAKKEIPNYKKTLYQQIIDDEELPSGVYEEFCYQIYSNRNMLKEALEKIEWIKSSERNRERNLKMLEVLINKVANEYGVERKVNKPY